MMKKIISLVLCLIMLASALVGCAKKDPTDKGAYVTMYLTDPVYNFDPALAYGNESALKVISLLFEPLFRLDDNGKVNAKRIVFGHLWELSHAQGHRGRLDEPLVRRALAAAQPICEDTSVVFWGDRIV